VEGGEKGRGEERRGREGKGGGPRTTPAPPPKLISPYALEQVIHFYLMN
jgi:hypothetical protein